MLYHSQASNTASTVRMPSQDIGLGYSGSGYDQPRLQYFTSRSNGTCVPLIPADELPFTVRLHGVPRVLTFDQTGGMQHVGASMYTGRVFELDANLPMPIHRPSVQGSGHGRSQSQATPKQFLAPDSLVRQALGCPVAATTATTAPLVPHPSLPARPASATSGQWRRAETSSGHDTQVS